MLNRGEEWVLILSTSQLSLNSDIIVLQEPLSVLSRPVLLLWTGANVFRPFVRLHGRRRWWEVVARTPIHIPGNPRSPHAPSRISPHSVAQLASKLPGVEEEEEEGPKIDLEEERRSSRTKGLSPRRPIDPLKQLREAPAKAESLSTEVSNASSDLNQSGLKVVALEDRQDARVKRDASFPPRPCWPWVFCT